jgi:LmbE family N-acetylglucosaminyl deacetylase
LAVGALLAHRRGARVTVYLTLCGGGAFGNRTLWILAAVRRALLLHRTEAIDVKLVHYRTVPKGPFVELEKEVRMTILKKQIRK